MHCLGQVRAAASLSELAERTAWDDEADRRRPIKALLRNGLADIRDALVMSNSLLKSRRSSQFYVQREADDVDAAVGADEDRFFEDLTVLYRRQTMLFKRSCQQLKELYDVSDSSNETMLADDIAKEDNSALSLGWSPFAEIDTVDVEELYVDCLFTVLHMIGSEAETNNPWPLVEHLRKAFRIEPKRHLELFEKASSRPSPTSKLNVCVVAAKDLVAKDISGLNDPFCTMYLKSRPLECLNTSCKVKTSKPEWNETFVLRLGSVRKNRTEDDEDETLHVDVWTFSPDEKFGEKLRRIGEVKDPRGLRQFIVDTVSASKGAAAQKLLGSLEVAIGEIPASGLNKWFPLEKISSKSHSRRSRGELHLQLHLSTSEKAHADTVADHRRLLRVLMAYELLSRGVAPHAWKEAFSAESLHILAQHAVQGQMSRNETTLTRWVVYCQAHAAFPIDYRVFTPMLDRVRKVVQTMTNETSGVGGGGEDVRAMLSTFHDAADIFVEQAVGLVRRHRVRGFGGLGGDGLLQLDHALRCLHVLHCLRWRTKDDVVIRVEEAVSESVRELYDAAMAKTKLNEDDSDYEDDDVSRLTRLTQLLVADLDACKERFAKMFRETLNIDYAELAFKEYERLLRPITEKCVHAAIDAMRPMAIIDNHDEPIQARTRDLAVGAKLFELYLALQKFYSSSEEATTEHSYYQWFVRAVAHWLDIALLRSIRRILKAIEMDDLRLTVDDLVLFTASAVDTCTVFGQVKTLWLQLRWPDPETAFVFISRILDDVCRATILYAERMCAKVERHAVVDDDAAVAVRFSAEQCLAVNNIDHVLQGISPLLLELGMGEVLVKIEQKNGGLVADACKKTLKTMLKNAVENVENQIVLVLEQICLSMGPLLTRYLMNSLCQNQRSNHVAMLQFLDENLIFLKRSLSSSNFERAHSLLWSVAMAVVADLAQQGVTNRMPPAHFAYLLDTYRVLLNFFYGDTTPAQDPSLPKITRLLRLYSSGTEGLVKHYLEQRYASQAALPTAFFPLGSVTVRVILLQRSHLRVEVLNARHLKPLSTSEDGVGESGTSVRTYQQRYSMSALHNDMASSASSSFLFNCYSTYPRARHRAHKATDLTLDGIVPQQAATTCWDKRVVLLRCYPLAPAPAHPDSEADSSPLDFLRCKFDTVRLNVQDAVTEAHMAMHKRFSQHCDPYISLSVVPFSANASRRSKVRTSTQSRTLFPLFDETFDLVLSEDAKIESLFLRICVKDGAVMRKGIFMGEAYLPLSRVEQLNPDLTLRHAPQLQLALTRPGPDDEDILFAIETRSADSATRQFLRKERRKIHALKGQS